MVQPPAPHQRLTEAVQGISEIHSTGDPENISAAALRCSAQWLVLDTMNNLSLLPP